MDELRIPFTEMTLPNGLRVVFSEDHLAPIVAITVYYDVGSRNERPGRTGFAHLFEHMMFQGSANVAKAEHFQLVYNSGGVLNGTTSEDVTRFFELLPSNQLALGLWLEADRMRSLTITPENLDNQRQAVKEERRLGIDNQPYGIAFERLNEIAYVNFPYGHSVIGSMCDLDAATVEDVREFFGVYYAPNNAVLVVAGDFDSAEAGALIETYFGNIPRGARPDPVLIEEPPRLTERRETISDPNAKLPAVIMTYPIPARRSADFFALGVLENLLVEGQSSRLYRKLIKDEEIAVQVDGGVEERRGPSVFYFFAVAHPGLDLTVLEASIDGEIEALAATAPSPGELSKAKNQLETEFVRGLAPVQGKSFTLAKYALFDDDPGLLAEDFRRYTEVSAEDVQRVAATYFQRHRRAVVTILPAAETSAEPRGGHRRGAIHRAQIRGRDKSRPYPRLRSARSRRPSGVRGVRDGGDQS